jgi:hypothetical protein
MAEAFTCQNDLFDQAPARRVLSGDKRKKAEPAQHVIEFPGGAVEVSRCEDGSYWAHIIINRDPLYSGPHKGRASAHGEVVGSRINWHERRLEGIPSIPDDANLTQIAVRIMPVRGEVEEAA